MKNLVISQMSRHYRLSTGLLHPQDEVQRYCCFQVLLVFRASLVHLHEILSLKLNLKGNFLLQDHRVFHISFWVPEFLRLFHRKEPSSFLNLLWKAPRLVDETNARPTFLHWHFKVPLIFEENHGKYLEWCAVFSQDFWLFQ